MPRRFARWRDLFLLLSAVVIVAFVAASAAKRWLRYDTGSRTRTAETNARAVRAAAALWRVERDSRVCPTLDDLYRDGVLDRNVPATDPWGTPWNIECSRDVR